MRKSWLVLLALACAAPAKAAETEEALASKLGQDATVLLEQLLGPGRAKVFIVVEGERSELKSESSLTTPVVKKGGEGNNGLTPFPGYEASPYLDKNFNYMQQDQQQSTRTSGFVIKKMTVSVLLDQGVPKDRADAVKRILADMLRLDPKRGDSLQVLPAELYPGWRKLFGSEELWRLLLSQLALIVGLLFVSAVGYLLLVRVTRVFAESVASRRAAATPGGALAGEVVAPGTPGLPSGFGGPPTLAGFGDGGEARGSLEMQPRFAYLAAKPPRDVSPWLQAESVDDVALLFCWLADKNPDLGMRLFAALPASFQVTVSKQMLKVKQADPERISILDNRLRTQAEFSLHGTEKLGQILGAMQSSDREDLLGELSAADQAGSRELRQSLVTFEELVNMKVQDLRRLVAAVPLPIWGAALVGAEKALADKVVELFPTGMRPMLRESLAEARPKEKVLEARSQILSQAFKMATLGQLALKPEAGGVA